MLTFFYQIMFIYFVFLFLWNMWEERDFYIQLTTIFVIIPFLLRILHIR